MSCNPVSDLIIQVEANSQRDWRGRFAPGNKLATLADRAKQFDRQIRIYISDDQYKRLKKKIKGRGLSEKVREYIEWGLENDG